MKNLIKLFCGSVAVAFAGQAFSATEWTLNTGSVAGSNTAVSATASGWANTGSGASADVQTLQNQPAGTNLQLYAGGLGINNLNGCAVASGGCDVGDLPSTAPEHAIDNNQRYEMVLLSFSQSVKLTNAKFGWTGTSNYSGGDSDYTIMAYTGSGAPTLTGKKWSDLAATNSGWTNIGNYSDAITGVNNAINSGNVYSSYWLIGAYNPLADPTGGAVTGGVGGNDYLKLAAVTGCVSGTSGCTLASPNSVPEPDSSVLFGVAFLAMLSLRKRRQG